MISEIHFSKLRTSLERRAIGLSKGLPYSEIKYLYIFDWMNILLKIFSFLNQPRILQANWTIPAADNTEFFVMGSLLYLLFTNLQSAHQDKFFYSHSSYKTILNELNAVFEPIIWKNTYFIWNWKFKESSFQKGTDCHPFNTSLSLIY